MKIKRTFFERLFSLTPWVAERNETQVERVRRFADTMQPSRPMHLVEVQMLRPDVPVRDFFDSSLIEPNKRVRWWANDCNCDCDQGRACTCRK